MRKEEFSFLSSDGVTNIRAIRYIPEDKPKAILQISHGMVEFIDRYELFAKYLTDRSILVTGNDHLGHGGSVTSEDNWGYFHEDEGYLKVLEDLHHLTLITKDLYPNIPYFLLGHSMGSFYARRYLFTYKNELDGAIIMKDNKMIATMNSRDTLAYNLLTNDDLTEGTFQITNPNIIYRN